MVPSSLPQDAVTRSPDPSASLHAALTGVCVVRLPEVGWIRVAGEDRVRWLNGMVTNSIEALNRGQGCETFLLSAQGRIQGTALAFAEETALLLETDRVQVEPLLAMLDRYIIMDDVELADVSDERAGLLVAGPGAAALLERAGLLDGPGGNELRAWDARWRETPVRVQQMAGGVVAQMEIWGPAAVMAALEAELGTAGAVAGNAAVLETLRLLEGRPKMGVDIRERELPQETGRTQALHFNKGCYLGQEIVERIRSRGSVHRTFRGFALEGAVPAPGAPLLAGGKAVGELTSVGVVRGLPGRTGDLQLGLGYVRREALELQQALTFEGGSAMVLALPLNL